MFLILFCLHDAACSCGSRDNHADSIIVFQVLVTAVLEMLSRRRPHSPLVGLVSQSSDLLSRSL